MIESYSDRVYKVGDKKSAQEIILTPLDGMTTEHRWETETPYLVALLEQETNLQELGCRRILDFGCGIGRVCQALLRKYPTKNVTGVDTSLEMLALAHAYVTSPRFFGIHPSNLNLFVHQFNLALAIWVLQHSNDPEEDVQAILRSLEYAGVLFVLNEKRRCVPSDTGCWLSDGINVQALLHKYFDIVREGHVDPRIMGLRAAQQTFWGVYRVKTG
jgi:ubiquinone/menaquinone biosynthesis C-methylase UbiE